MKTFFRISTLLLFVGAIVTGCGGGSGSSSGPGVSCPAAYPNVVSNYGVTQCCMSGVSGAGYGTGYGYNTGYGAQSGCVAANVGGISSPQGCQQEGGTLINLGGGQEGCCPPGAYPSILSAPVQQVLATCPAVANTGYGTGYYP